MPLNYERLLTFMYTRFSSHLLHLCIKHTSGHRNTNAITYVMEYSVKLSNLLAFTKMM